MQDSKGSGDGWVFYEPLGSDPVASGLQAGGGSWLYVFAALFLLIAAAAIWKRKWGAATLSGVLAGMCGLALWLGRAPQFETSFFDPAGGGDPVLLQHVFWFLGHPEVYGAVIQLALVVFGFLWAGRRISQKFGRTGVVGFLLVMATLSGVIGVALIRVFNAFRAGAPELITWESYPLAAFSWMSLIIGFGLVAWLLLALWRWFPVNPAAALFALSAALLAGAGLLSGLQMADADIGAAYHDTYYIIAHRDYVITLIAPFLLFMLAYVLFEPVIGAPYNRWLAGAHWLTCTAGVAMVFAPQVLLAGQGMPRRYVDYSEIGGTVALWDTISSAGAFVALISLVLFAICLVDAMTRRYRREKG